MIAIFNTIKKIDPIRLSTNHVYSLLLILLLLIGCAFLIKIKSHAYQNTWVKSDKNKSTSLTDTSDHQKPLPTYHTLSYNNHSQRDPFHNMTKTQENNITNSLENDITHFDINTLKMIGYIDQNQQASGIMQAPTGAVYFVSIGDFIGTEMATVTTISQNEITADLPNMKPKNAIAFEIEG